MPPAALLVDVFYKIATHQNAMLISTWGQYLPTIVGSFSVFLYFLIVEARQSGERDWKSAVQAAFAAPGVAIGIITVILIVEEAWSRSVGMWKASRSSG
jgi:ABC-type tungstate transport system substrate-binding protein